MRSILMAVFALTLALPAAAQQISPMTGTTAAPPELPAAAEPATPRASNPAPKAPRRRMTLQQRFTAANTSHDGKLTIDQAREAKMAAVVRNFDAIDTAKKGYVTVSEIRAYRKAQRAAHKASKPKT